MTSGEPLLEVRDLRCHLPGDHGVVRAVDGVSLTLGHGRVLGLVGESGCGKSTLVRALVGASAPGAGVSGSVILAGTDLTAMPPEARRAFVGRHVGMVFQDPMSALNPVVPVGRQIGEAVRHHLGLSRAAARDRAAGLLEQVGVPDPGRRLKHYPHQFSGGLRQRITIAMALSCDPALLIADEATTALDVTVQRQILDLLAGLAGDRGMGLVLVSHDLGVIAGRADEIAVMYAGRVVEHGLTRAVFARPRHRYTEALLGAIPRLDAPPHARLRVIPGAPPDLADPPPGCAFAPRCPAARPDCLAAPPPLVAEGPHAHACLYPADGAEITAGARRREGGDAG
ncbi:ATP-binding cassette domain-containing protein [Nonomuraea phyllanthi]|uniref:ATP-binding cassette domain-containing protein n=1 Tax=Nonomuraea phyllanthi TaxID=2219224 RepID=A0A5C4VMT3_9ACTN|nr:ABC transporter ATP-binding protein [Nonomuraea phyllanthi]KAB8189647.1 ATP-binding cassette domain-containing protein [Nonomuraea phyllanthi]